MTNFVLVTTNYEDPQLRLALAAFLARYREPTLRSYQHDLSCYLTWCRSHRLDPSQAERAHLELWLRTMEQAGYAQATIARRFGTVAGFYRFAVLDGRLLVDPTVHVARPKVAWENQRRTVLHPLEYAALLTAARRESPSSHALVALLGMLGLRVSEACGARVTDLTLHSGYELLTVLGKGRKVAQIPLPVPVLRAVHEAIADRHDGPILLNMHGHPLTAPNARIVVQRLAKAVGLTHPVSPHSLRRTFCTAGLVAGVPLRDMQYAMRHADARTTMRYDMARANLDRHAAHPVAAYLAGMALD